MTASCKTTQRALSEAISLAEVTEITLAHARGCASCGAALAQHQAMAAAMAQARTAHQGSADLPPSSWVTMRARIDQTIARDQRRIFGVSLPRLAAFTTAAALCAVGAWAVVGQDAGTAERLDGRTLASAAVNPPLQVVVAPRATEGGERIAVTEGTTLTSTEAARVLSAYGRHAITLDAASAASVKRWDSKKIALDLAHGSVTCDVNRAEDEEIFEIHAGDVRVRVLGTVFTVTRDLNAGVTVSVARGRVSVTEGDAEPVFISAGESLAFPGPTTASAAVEVEAPAPEVVATTEPTPPRTQAAARRAPRTTPGTKVKEIEVPAQAMDAPPTDYKLDSVLPAVMQKMRVGRCDQALPALRIIDRKIGASPETARVYYLMAWCEQEAGRDAKANALYKKYQRLSPGGRWSTPGLDGAQPTLPASY